MSILPLFWLLCLRFDELGYCVCTHSPSFLNCTQVATHYLEKGLIVSRCAVVRLCFSYSLCANLTLFVIPPRWRWRRPPPPPAAIHSSYRLASDESQRQGNCVPPELKTSTTTATAAEKTKNEKGSRQLPHINWSTSEMVDDNNNNSKKQ